jgi:hypothetical protein
VDSGRLLFSGSFFQHSHDVALFHDEIFDPVELDLGARPFPEQDVVTDLEVDRDELAVSSRPPGPTAMTSPCCGFSLAVSGMMMPPTVFSSASMRLTTTRS